MTNTNHGNSCLVLPFILLLHVIRARVTILGVQLIFKVWYEKNIKNNQTGLHTYRPISGNSQIESPKFRVFHFLTNYNEDNVS